MPKHRVHPVLVPPHSPRWLSGSLTSDLISPPLSPQAAFNPNQVTPAVLAALTYVAGKLLSASSHLTFIVTRSLPLPIGQGSNLTAISITPLDSNMSTLLKRYLNRAAKKYSLSANWMVPLSLGHSRTSHWEYTVQRTLMQNDPLFSHEALTLLNIDHIFSLKQQLNVLSTDATSPIPNHVYLESCMYLLQQIMQETRGRPLTRKFFHCTYDHIHVRDDVLLHLTREHEIQFGYKAIIMFKPSSKGRTRSRYFITDRGSLKKQPSSWQNALTPNSASDVTPITRNEWKLLEQNLRQIRPRFFR
ncbi:hypothetical protein LOZ58_006430 [Ophidiomyces ophidiicola]|nr:hypothetical protein LOZ65_002322 [Ophidiomyces ophidiicola]KAI1956353.1 hypothetical protein LOZ58_006430 [Ophidiomyces ophidiicola]